MVHTEVSELRMSAIERLKLTCQHWRNTVAALVREQGSKDVMVVKIEGFLQSPADSLQEICDFLHLPYSEDYLPAARHSLPLGTRRRERWFPLKTDINSRYTAQLDAQATDLIEELTYPYATQLGYVRPNDPQGGQVGVGDDG